MESRIVNMTKLVIIPLLLIACHNQVQVVQEAPFQNPNLPVDQRVEDLVSRMTIEEKISQMSHLAPAIPRLGVVIYDPNLRNPLVDDPYFDEEEITELEQQRPWENLEYWNQGECIDGGWWNEALHGVARAGLATAFPQCIGLGSSWNPELIQKMGGVIGTEARVHNNIYGKKLTFWSPTINILRDPRWGRTEESYSEDPLLLSRMAVAFVTGVQGDHPKYLRAIATVKHFVANNSEYNRHDGSADVSERFLREYYMPAFKAAITEGGAYSVMGAYNAVNGVPACANEWLMTEVLRGEWGFKGYVVSDCGAVSDIVHNHKYEPDREKAVAMAVKAGTDLECETCEHEQFMYDKYLLGAYKKGHITEAEIDIAVKRLFRARMLLGEFDPPEHVPFTRIPRERLDSPEHRDLALQIARETMVLLKNEDKTLPLHRDEIQSIAVIGPTADIVELGGYSGSPAVEISPLQGIEDKVGNKVEVNYSVGCEISDRIVVDWDDEKDRPIWKELNESGTIAEAVAVAGETDVAIVCLGTDLTIANEAGDRDDLDLPGNQLKLVQEVYAANPRTVVVLINGMPLSINWVDEHIPAILEAWYPGQAGGAAIADVLFGDYNPGGKLPVTFYKGVNDLPPLGDYDITKGHTYWYYQGEVLYPFGHGLSYTNFAYSNLKMPEEVENGKGVKISVDVTNADVMAGDEVVQLYIHDVDASVLVAKRKLQGFKRTHLKPGETKTVEFTLTPAQFAFVNDDMQWMVEPGKFIISVGGRQPGQNESSQKHATDITFGELILTGDNYIVGG